MRRSLGPSAGMQPDRRAQHDWQPSRHFLGKASSPGVRRALGDGQTWQDVSGSRTSGTTYQNTTQSAIMVNAGTTNATVNGATVGISALVGTADPPTLTVWDTDHNHGSSAGTANFSCSFVVPSGWYYSVTFTGGTISFWSELR